MVQCALLKTLVMSANTWPLEGTCARQQNKDFIISLVWHLNSRKLPRIKRSNYLCGRTKQRKEQGST